MPRDETIEEVFERALATAKALEAVDALRAERERLREEGKVVTTEQLGRRLLKKVEPTNVVDALFAIARGLHDVADTLRERE